MRHCRIRRGRRAVSWRGDEPARCHHLPGGSVDELKQALAGSVEDYLAFCKERGEEPEKPYSGQFVVRVEPPLHKAVVTAAKRAGLSLNKWVAATLERAAAGR